ncbi:MAG: glutathione S-transferase family protein [Polyangiaceae bacterium]
MSLVFYYAPMSTADVTNLVLAELDIPHERVVLDLRAGDNTKPEFLKLNPNCKVPLIVHDGTPIFESAAITMYLGELFGTEKGLYPKPGPRRGEAMKWIVWTNVTLGGAVTRWTHNFMDWVPAEQHNAKAAEAGRASMMECLAVLDGALADRQFLCGEYTLADAHLNAFVDWLRFMKVDMSALKNVLAWGERCMARPAYAKIRAAYAGG